jgi:hypothetical protein
MNKSFRIFFSSVAVLRLLSVIAIFVIEAWYNNQGKSGSGAFDGLHLDIDLEIEWWEWLAMYTVMVVYPANTIISLILSFKPQWIFTSFLKRRIFPAVLYTCELILIPFFAYLAFEKVQDTFYPPEHNDYLGQFLKTIFPGDNGRSVYEKADAINLCVLTFCGIVFLASFWSFYKARKKMYEMSAIQ